MLNISKYLEKFTKNLQSGEIITNKILEVIKNKANINLSSQDIELKNNIIQLKPSPAYKNKIFIYKQEIISEINTSIGINIIDIR